MYFGMQPLVISHVIVHWPSEAGKMYIESLALHVHNAGECLVDYGLYVCRIELFLLKSQCLSAMDLNCCWPVYYSLAIFVEPQGSQLLLASLNR